MKKKILLVDDDRALATSLSRVLTNAGYEVALSSNGVRALEALRVKCPDLVLLDVSMPGMSGYDVCREIRRTDAAVPVVFLTALDTPDDELTGLSSGGDLYIPKTTPDEVLLARLAALFRPRSIETGSAVFDFGPWRILAANMEMRFRDGERRESLIDREIALLRLFAAHPGEVLDRDALMTRLWGVEAQITDTNLTKLLYNLRQKLGRTGNLIQSVRGVGYVYRP